jgi:transposase
MHALRPRASVPASTMHEEGVGVLAGIDTHKDTLAVAVSDDAGRPVVVTELANTETDFDALEALLAEHAVSRIGIEGSGNYGRGAAVRLVLAGGSEVVEVPPSLTSRERSGRPGQGKTDPVDAVAIARITAREPGLPPVRLADGQAADLRALADYRTQLIAERTSLANRTHTELHGLQPGYQRRVPRLTAPTFIATARDLLAGDDSVRAQLTRRRLTRLAELTTEIQEVTALIAAAVEQVNTGLTELYGLGPVGAATILGEVAASTAPATAPSTECSTQWRSPESAPTSRAASTTRSATCRGDSPASSRRVAAVLRKVCEVTHDHGPSSQRRRGRAPAGCS